MASFIASACASSSSLSLWSQQRYRFYCKRSSYTTIIIMPSNNATTTRIRTAVAPPSCQVGGGHINLQHSSIETRDESKEIPMLNAMEVLTRLHDNEIVSNRQQAYYAMYSSVLGGIITDPALMLIPIDDHMVHRGHGVFDTALIIDGHIYELDPHLDRLLRSANMAMISPPMGRSTLKDTLIQTVAASNCKQGFLRYWISAGPGGFCLSPAECTRSAFYAIVMGREGKDYSEGVKVTTSTVSMKPPLFATMKNVNYLPNVLSMMEAESQGSFAGIWVDDKGDVAEGPNMNVAFVSKDRVLLVPAFDAILSGCTVKRLLALARNLILPYANGSSLEPETNPVRLKGIHIGKISVSQGKNAAEMMLIGSGLPVAPVIQWDDHIIGDGVAGPITKALLTLLMEDMHNSPDPIRIRVNYRDQQNQ